MRQTGRASSNPIKKSSRRVWERSGQGVTMLCAWTMDSCMDLLRPRAELKPAVSRLLSTCTCVMFMCMHM